MAGTSGRQEEWELVMGIYFGTTNSSVSVWNGSERMVIHPTAPSPSVVAFTCTGTLVGGEAKNGYLDNLKTTIFGLKRWIGLNSDEMIGQLNHFYMEHLEILNNTAEGVPVVVVDHVGETRRYNSVSILSNFLHYMRQLATNKVRKLVTNAVITLPVYFKDHHCQAILHAARIAKINVLQTIPEPVAAIWAYKIHDRSFFKNILVIHLGGATYMLSFVQLKPGMHVLKSVGGDPDFGGDRFDSRMIRHFTNEFQLQHEITFEPDRSAKWRLKNKWLRAKKELSYSLSATVKVEGFHEGIDLESTVTRPDFERINKDLFSNCMNSLRCFLCKSNVMADEVDEVVLTGGSTKIPRIRELVQKLFPEKTIHMGIMAELVVSQGVGVFIQRESMHRTNL